MVAESRLGLVSDQGAESVWLGGDIPGLNKIADQVRPGVNASAGDLTVFVVIALGGGRGLLAFVLTGRRRRSRNAAA